MRKDRVKKVWAEVHRLIDAIKELDEADKALAGMHRGEGKIYHNSPRESGTVRRASMDVTRALAELRRADYP